MGKVVYNACYGGFGLSHKAIKRYAELKGLKLYDYGYDKFILCPVEEYERVYEEAKLSDRPDRYEELNKLGFYDHDLERDDPILVQVVEELGSKAASGCFAKLAIVELPPGTLYKIDEYDGYESIVTKDDVEWKVAK